MTLLLKRVLPEVSPGALASLTGARLPPTGFSIVSPLSEGGHQVGLLDNFLSVIAKALILQVKVKGTNGSKVVNSLKLHDVELSEDHSWWYLKGISSRKLADDIIQILWDMSNVSVTRDENHRDRGSAYNNIVNPFFFTPDTGQIGRKQ